MPQYEYKVVPAPVKAEKAKGLKGTQAKFAHTLMALMNELGRDGWEYQRADALPCEERSGLTGKTTTFQNMLIFRRALAVEEAQVEAPFVPAPTPQSPEEIAAAAAASLSAGEIDDSDEAAVDAADEAETGPSVLQEHAARRNEMAAQ